MRTLYRIISLLGGLSMFPYGMRVMGDALKSSSGTAMRTALKRVTANSFMGFLLGVIVTCAIQSSTATIVLTVGLVGAGLLTFRQSVGIVFGANVGTAITAQIIRLMDLQAGESSILYFFKADNLAPLALIIGIVFIMFLGSKGNKNTGSIFCGFGVLFMGLMAMRQAVESFKEPLASLLTSFESNYFYGFLAGAGVTGIIQSSSAVVGILQSVASSVGITFSAVFAVIVGVNIGDCVTTFLVSRIGAKPNQIRTTLVHIIYNIFAAILIFIVIGIGRAAHIIPDSIFFKVLNSGGVANVHGLFRLVPAILLLPFSGFFASLAEKIMPDKPMESEDVKAEELIKALDTHLNITPGLALDQAERTLSNMAELARHNFEAARRQIFEFDEERTERITTREKYLDRMTDATSQYLLALTPNIKRKRDLNRQNFMLKTAISFERIGDLDVNICDNVDKLRSTERHFSEQAEKELRVVFAAVESNLALIEKAFSGENPDGAYDVEPLEEVIDDLIEHLKAAHIQRMANGLCSVEVGIPFQDMLSNLERISDQCSDIAIYLIEQAHPEISGNEHGYVYELHAAENERYLATFKKERDKYFSQLSE